MKHLWSFLGGIALCAIITAAVIVFYPELLFTSQPPKIALAHIPEHAIKMYKSKYVEVKAGRSQSSGCLLEPGVYLTAFHGVVYPWLDKEAIYVNGAPARLVWHSKTDQDYAILTTKEKFDDKRFTLPLYEFKIGDDIVIVGSPGTTTALVEPGKIINTDVKDAAGNLKIGAKQAFSIYIESGISGGCVYPLGSDYPVAVVTKKDGNPDKTIGEISLVSKVAEGPPATSQ